MIGQSAAYGSSSVRPSGSACPPMHDGSARRTRSSWRMRSSANSPRHSMLEQMGITDRELDVIRLLTRGLGNSEIAERLVISPRTVHAHLRSIFTKLGVTNRAAAAHEATRLELV